MLKTCVRKEKKLPFVRFPKEETISLALETPSLTFTAESNEGLFIDLN
jgi:hypothetical protein